MPYPERNRGVLFTDDQDALVSYILAVFEETRIVTKATVFDLTLTELDWIYDKGWNSIGALLEHIISNENIFRIKYLEKRSLTEDEKYEYGPGRLLGDYVSILKGRDLDYYFDRLDATRECTLQHLRNKSQADFTEQLPGSSDETSNLSYAIYHEIEDELQHKGQMVLLKKLMKMNLNKH